MTTAVPRERCLRCRRPRRVCYCAALTSLPTTTRVVILQHPRERDMPIGTARMAHLCLPNSELHVGVRWQEDARLAQVLADPARPAVLLYPGRDARDILSEPPQGPVTLVVIDGTWSQAKTVVRDNPVLQALPRYAFAAPAPSEYRIRKEPEVEYVSTIEALMHVLGALEGEPERFRALLVPLRAMVDTQLECQKSSPRTLVRHSRKRKPIAARVPVLLRERFADLVCVVGEANAWPHAAGPQAPPHELVHLVAHRIGDGATFSVVSAPRHALAPAVARHVGIAESELRAGCAPAELVARFAAFLRPSDVPCAWGHYALNLLVGAGGTAPQLWLDLRQAARTITQRRIGSLETFVATQGTPPPALAVGRAGQRAAWLAKLVRDWKMEPDSIF